MADPRTDGRMVRKDVSDSLKIAALSPQAAVLFFMLIPHYNSHGKMNGGPGHIKDEIVPHIDYFTYDNLAGYLLEISDKTNVKWFRRDGRYWIHSLKFLSDHQKLDAKKLGADLLPSYSGVSLELSPEIVGHEVEVEGEEKEEGEEAAASHSQSGGTAPAREAPAGKAGGEGKTENPPAMTRSERVLRECVRDKRPEIERLFPHAVIAVEEELLVAKYRERPVGADPWLLVLRWFQAVPKDRARASPKGGGGLTAEEVEMENRRILREFCGVDHAG